MKFGDSMKNIKISQFFAFGLIACAVGAVAQTDGYVAGLQPDRRPDMAPPQPTDTVRTSRQLEYALHGIEKPVPGNVESIAATGNWWVPLRYPGMNQPYDLRGWHDAPIGMTAVPASTPSITQMPTH
jgi:hypothetical protein